MFKPYTEDRKKKGVKRGKERKDYPVNRKLSPFEEFCDEMDLFCEQNTFPEWVFQYREQFLAKISSKLKKICRLVKEHGIGFKIYYPIQINGKWKFADLYIPSKRTVVILNTLPHSPGYLSQRASFFQDRCKVYELDGYENQESLTELICKLR